jgi:cytochrome c-type biogenesis protein CcmH
MLWFALAGMTGLAVLIALWPLAFRRGPRADPGREAEFHRAQLAEIERDVERGVMPREEAAGARAEAARRLIAASAAPPVGNGADTGRRRVAAVVILIAIPLVALGVYGKLGRPDEPDAPLSARKAGDSSPEALEAAIAKIEAHLAAEPDDRRGWSVLAPVLMRMGRFDDAVGAYRQLVRLDGRDGEARADYAEALVARADGVVTAEAREAFDRALALTPNLPIARFYLALAAEQDGDAAKAREAYEALLPEAKGRAPWMIGLRARLAALNGEAPAVGEAGPAATDSSTFSPEQRKMIEGMVSGLATRLAQNGGSPEEWARLIRAYSVLHNREKAEEALASARKALGSNGDIDALARELGL